MAKLKAYYFSPTGGTFHVAEHLAGQLGGRLGLPVECHSYTLPAEREVLPTLDADDVVLWATPVYAGRIPNKTLDYVRRAIHGSGNPAVALVTFGNRAYDNALAELVGLMLDGGLRPVGGAAVVTRHAFSDILGAGRPDAVDLAAIDRFAGEVAERIPVCGDAILTVPGEAHPERYYTPPEGGQRPGRIPQGAPLVRHRQLHALRQVPVGLPDGEHRGEGRHARVRRRMHQVPGLPPQLSNGCHRFHRPRVSLACGYD